MKPHPIFILSLFVIAVAFGAGAAFHMNPAEAQSAFNVRRVPVSSEVAYTAITATGMTGTTGTTGVLTLARECAALNLQNTTNVELVALINSTKKRVPAGTGFQMNFGSADTRLATGTTIKVYNNGASAPSSGVFEAFCQIY